jgi:hypothetical protein
MRGLHREKSIVGKRWDSIGYKPARENTYTTYQFIDKAPISNINYYRLKLVTKQHCTYSEIREVSFTSRAAIRAYPNPAKDFINIAGLETKATAMVLDMSGHVLSTQLLRQQNDQVVLSGLAAGIYQLNIMIHENLVVTFKVTKTDDR